MANKLMILPLLVLTAVAHAQQDLKAIMDRAKNDPTLVQTEADLNAFLKANPTNKFAWLNLALVQEKKKDVSNAMVTYQKVVQMDANGAWGAEAKMRFALLKFGPQGDDRALSLLGQSLIMRNAGKLVEAMDLAAAARSHAVTVGWQCDLIRANILSFFGQLKEAETLLTNAQTTAPATGQASLQEELRRVRFKEYVAGEKDKATEASKAKASDSMAKLENAWRLDPDDTYIGLMLASEAASAKSYFLAEEVCQTLANSSSAEARAPAIEINKMIQELRTMERDLKIGSVAELGADSTLKGMGNMVDLGTDIDDDETPVTFVQEVVSSETRKKKAEKVISIDLDYARSVLKAYSERESAWKAVAADILAKGGDPTFANERAASATSLVRLAKRKISVLELVLSLFSA